MIAVPVRFDMGDGYAVRTPSPTFVTTGPRTLPITTPTQKVPVRPTVPIETPITAPPKSVPVSPVPPSGDGITDGASGLGTFFNNLFYPSGQQGTSPAPAASGSSVGTSSILTLGLIAVGLYLILRP